MHRYRSSPGCARAQAFRVRARQPGLGARGPGALGSGSIRRLSQVSDFRSESPQVYPEPRPQCPKPRSSSPGPLPWTRDIGPRRRLRPSSREARMGSFVIVTTSPKVSAFVTVVVARSVKEESFGAGNSRVTARTRLSRPPVEGTLPTIGDRIRARRRFGFLLTQETVRPAARRDGHQLGPTGHGSDLLVRRSPSRSIHSPPRVPRRAETRPPPRGGKHRLVAPDPRVPGRSKPLQQ